MRTIITLALLLQAAVALGQDSWTCTTIGNVITCQGFQNGRWVTCQTTRIGNQTNTQCW
jgi:hypothetical protein